MRRALAINATILEELALSSLKNKSHFNLLEPWALDAEEATGKVAAVALMRPIQQRESRLKKLFFGPRGAFGMFLARATALGVSGRLDMATREKVIKELFQKLSPFIGKIEGYKTGPRTKETVYRLNAGLIVFKEIGRAHV